MLRAEVFGGLSLTVDGAGVSVGGAQRQRVAALLLCNAGEVVPAHRIWDRLDPGGASSNPANAVQAHVHRLRQAIEPGTNGRSAVRLRSVGDGYVLTPDSFDLWDYRSTVEAAVQAANRNDPDAAVESYASALSMWSTPFGSLGDDSSIVDVVRALDEEHLAVEDAWAEAVIAVGATSVAADALLRIALREPTRERRCELAMQALAQVGRQSDALRLFDRVAAGLRDELGIDPGPSLADMQYRVLVQDPALRSRPTRVQGGSVPVHVDSFVGRDGHLARLGELLDGNRLVTVTGLAGVGKSRLVREWLSRSCPTEQAAWVHVVDVGGPDAVADGVREALGFGNGGDEVDALDAACAAVPATPFVLVLDGAEVRLADCRRTLLALIAARPRLLVVATSQVALGLPHEQVLALTPLELDEGPTGARGSALDLALARLGPTATPTAACELARRCNGLPLAIELAAANDRVAAVPASAEAGHHPALDDIVHAAAVRLSPNARSLLQLASLSPAGLSSEAIDWFAGSSATEPDPWAGHRLVCELVESTLVVASPASASIRHRPLHQVGDVVRSALDDATRRRLLDDGARWLEHLSRSDADDLVVRPDTVLQRLLIDEAANIDTALDHRRSAGSTVPLVCAIVPQIIRLRSSLDPRRWVSDLIADGDHDEFDAARLALIDAAMRRDLASIAARSAEIDTAMGTLAHVVDRSSNWWLMTTITAAIARGWNGDLAGARQALGEARRAAGTCEWAGAMVDRYEGLLQFAEGSPLPGYEMTAGAARQLEDLGSPGDALGAYFHAITLGRALGLEGAEELLERASALARTGPFRLSSLIDAERAQLARSRGQADAPTLLMTAAIHLERDGFLRTAATTRRDLGLLLVDSGELDAADDELTRAADWLLVADPAAAALALAALAACRVGTDRTGARRLACAANALRGAHGTPPGAEDLRRLDHFIELVGADPAIEPVTLDASAVRALRRALSEGHGDPSDTSVDLRVRSRPDSVGAALTG